MPDIITGVIDRKYMRHIIDAGSLCHGATAEWEILGEDFEEYSVELNPDVEQTKNILGETNFTHNGFESTSEASPYKARTGSALWQKIQDIIDNRYKDDNCKTSALEVHLWDVDNSGKATAWKQDCYVVPTSYGGDTSAYQTPFSVYYVGARVKGKWDGETKTFTADGASATSLSD